VLENGPDDGRVIDAADDPHGALTFWADKGIDFVDFLNQSRTILPEGLFISLLWGTKKTNWNTAF